MPTHKNHGKMPTKGKPVPGKHMMPGKGMMADEDMDKMHKGKK